MNTLTKSLLACALGLASIAPAAALPNTATSKRVIYYDQTIYNGSSAIAGNYVSLAPIWDSANLNPSTGKPYVTDVIVGALHLGSQSDGSSLHLNDNALDDSIFIPLWQDVANLQSRGVNVLAMLGGAGQGSYANLFDGNGELTSYYDVLKSALQTYHFNGIDLDIEESVSQDRIEALIGRLRQDFGSDFLITMAPVASALEGNTDPFSGFNYQSLYADQGSNIDWFNVQFYSGFGTLSAPDDYKAVIQAGFPASKVVAGSLSNAANGSGFVAIDTVRSTVSSLLQTYPDLGGVDAWEYFNAEPGGTAHPEQWGTSFGKVLNQ